MRPGAWRHRSLHAYLLDDLQVADADKPTRANVEARLRDLRQRVQPEDTVLFFFSGHGAVDKTGTTYLLTRDADSHNGRLKQTALDRVALDDLLKSLPARHVVLFLDACHAAGVMGDAPRPGRWRVRREVICWMISGVSFACSLLVGRRSYGMRTRWG